MDVIEPKTSAEPSTIDKNPLAENGLYQDFKKLKLKMKKRDKNFY